MPGNKGKIKEFFEQEADKLAEKIERTPVEKFFIFFLVMVTAAALIMGYFQFRKNIESPLFSSYLSQERATEYQKYLNATQNTNTISLPTILSPVTNSTNLNESIENSNANSAANYNPDVNSSDLAAMEQQLLSGTITLKDLGIDNPQLQQQLDQLKTGELNVNQLTTEDKQVIENLKNLTPAEIRAELIKQGIDKTELDQISDTDLQNLFLQMLNQYQ
jgi:hypothetical protein